MSCDLCSATDALSTYEVPSRGEPISVCGACLPQIEGADLDDKHWFCLQEAAWSEEPAVQVVALRLLARLREHSWANDLREQLYIDDDVLAWANEGQDDRPPVVDSNGTPLRDGDSVTLIKDLPVRGANFTAKRGTMVKGIRLGDDPTHVEGRVNKMAIMLKTEFLKKAG